MGLFMDALSRINEIIEPSLSAVGYALVQVKLADGKRKTLSIMAERADGVMMSFDDCELITNTVSALLDVEEPISGAYNLEVCSPGLDRPLVRKEDYTRFAGQDAKMETIIPVSGRKRFRGTLKGLVGDAVSIHTTEGEFELPLSHIRTAKLVPSDEIVRKNLNKQKAKG
jgi:ribosome maturation factor RimP